MTTRARLLILLIAVLVLGGAATAVVLRAAGDSAQRAQTSAGDPPVRPGPVTLTPAGRQLAFRNLAMGPHQDEIAAVDADADHADAERTVGGVKCMRFYAAAGTGICLQAQHSALGDIYHAVILDRNLHELHRFPLAGVPSRARVSPSGHLAAWTVFVSGESYSGGGFSTRTSLVDTRTWKLTDTLETFSVVKDGHPHRSPDTNFWGVTFADDNRFYATLATGGQTYLAQGDLGARTLTTLHQNVECPSLSPDGTRIAYKKRVPGAAADTPWRLYVLDLATMTETATAETRPFDDQVMWADDTTLVYALPGSHGWDVWTAPADGTGTPRKLAEQAASPSYLG
ncbi:TolB family protein [Streptomyces sp. NPDC101160]|uniref:TolB family protein n=1 Tax=Streptomyces sp. NPDC101160 TaxID=3366118 RepID=UPI0037F70358